MGQGIMETKMKTGGTHPREDVKKYLARLKEISETMLGALTDDEVMRLLAERKQTELMRREHEVRAQMESVDVDHTKVEAALARDRSGESTQEGGEMQSLLAQLDKNKETLGLLLQALPPSAKANKAFMLKVAEVDPAYAMHYADIALKKEEDFNMRAVGMAHGWYSSNVLSEMLPEARTGKVVLIGVRQDYRNIRFAVPNMEAYREMLEIAKKGALLRIETSSKEHSDRAVPLPKILQKDTEFMRTAEKFTLAASPV